MGSGQCQRTDGHSDQPEYQSPCATHYSVAGAGTTGGECHNQPTVDHGDEPRHKSDDGFESPGSGSRTIGWASQSQPTDAQADQRQHHDRGRPESPEGNAVNRSGGWLGNVRRHQDGVYKPTEQGGGSHGADHESEASFHRVT
jgi:hypothetical protein